MIYTPKDLAWIKRKAAEFADQSGYPDAMAVSLAMVEFQRMQEQPKASVVPIKQTLKPVDQ